MMQPESCAVGFLAGVASTAIVMFYFIQFFSPKKIIIRVEQPVSRLGFPEGSWKIISICGLYATVYDEDEKVAPFLINLRFFSDLEDPAPEDIIKVLWENNEKKFRVIKCFSV